MNDTPVSREDKLTVIDFCIKHENADEYRLYVLQTIRADIQTAPPDEREKSYDRYTYGEFVNKPKVKPPTERGEGDTCGFCNGPTRHITDGDWCTRCGTMNTDESITAPTDDELKPTPGTQWTHECDRCGAIAKNPALMCCAICDEGRMVKINGNG